MATEGSDSLLGGSLGQKPTDQRKADKEAKKRERLAQQEKANAVLSRIANNVEADDFGFLPLIRSTTRTNRVWHSVGQLSGPQEGIWVRARLEECRCKGSIGFLKLRQQTKTIQAVLNVNNSGVSKDMIRWAGNLPLESVVDIYCDVVVPDVPISSTTEASELLLRKIFCVSRSQTELPFQLKDANKTDVESAGNLIHVHQDVRLDNRVLDLRTIENNAIFRVQSAVGDLFREFLKKEGFVEIHTPKLICSSSEGGANVFSLPYFGRQAFLAQSPQLYKQMAISADLERVFEIGPVFRAENSNTHRHLCEFVGLDLEMTFKEHYFEVLELINDLFYFIFSGLEERCSSEIATVRAYNDAKPLKYLPKAPILEFEQGAKMLRDAGYAIPEDITNFDISTEQEKALGALVRVKYDTDFYMMVRYPLAVRAFYSMPAVDDTRLSNSYDCFIRGEEILSGAQRIHDPDMLSERASACGISPASIKSYIDAFRLGTCPHAGVGIGLERVVMLFLGLKNIRKTSMFPRDPKRLEP